MPPETHILLQLINQTFSLVFSAKFYKVLLFLQTIARSRWQTRLRSGCTIWRYLGGWGSTWSSLRFWHVPSSSDCLSTSSLSPWLRIQHRFSCVFLSKQSRRSLAQVLLSFRNLIWRTSFTIPLGLSARRTERGWLASILSYLLVFFIYPINQNQLQKTLIYAHIINIQTLVWVCA